MTSRARVGFPAACPARCGRAGCARAALRRSGDTAARVRSRRLLCRCSRTLIREQDRQGADGAHDSNDERDLGATADTRELYGALRIAARGQESRCVKEDKKAPSVEQPRALSARGPRENPRKSCPAGPVWGLLLC